MSNNNETKPQIKINKKMRMWNKYRMVCIMAAVALVVVIAAVAVVKVASSGKNNGDVTASLKTDISTPATEATTQAVSQESTQAAEQTTAAQETTTASTASSGSTLTVSGTVSAVQFTSKDFYSNAVFLGDSIVSGISTYGYLDDVFGNVNATSAKLENYVSTAVATKPDKLFIMVGHNDANYGTIKEETLASNVIDLVEAVHKSSSSTKVYVLSMTPVTAAYEKKTSNNVTQSYIDTANALLEQNASANNYTYIDIASAYKDDTGYLNQQCTGNGINITTSYYPFMLNGIAEVAK
jgi:lysophospholipase L1-like esterase